MRGRPASEGGPYESKARGRPEAAPTRRSTIQIVGLEGLDQVEEGAEGYAGGAFG
jgi:hypothetical protein